MGLFGKSQLEKNVEKLLADQERVLANQGRFLANNDKIIENQQKILLIQEDVLKYLNVISTSITRLGVVITENQRIIEKKINVVESAVYDLLLRSGPGPVTITVLGENWENGMAITFKVDLPPKSAPDVVSRKLTVKIGDAEAQTFELGAEERTLEGLEGPQDASVEVSLVDVDDAGLESGASTATGVLIDSFAPPTPGALGIVVLGETFEEPPVEEPPVEEPPVEEPPVEEPPVEEPPVEEPPVEEPPVEEPPVEEPPVEEPPVEEPAPEEDPGLPTDEENV